MFGGSTGGWMTLAQQILYPEYFGGAWHSGQARKVA
jgi:enterochelin esterase-like enzyme